MSSDGSIYAINTGKLVTADKVSENDFISDELLFLKCKRFGAQTLEARRKFEGLLPEVNKRRLYEKKGFNSIFEFAAKLAGMNREQVQRVLQLERKFEDIPLLKAALVSGDVGFNKLARVASIATKENQDELLDKAKVLSRSALDVFVKDVKRGIEAEEDLRKGLFGSINDKRQVGLHKPLKDFNSVSGHRINEDIELIQTLSGEVKLKLLELKEKGLNINEILLELLQRREEEIVEEKDVLAQKEITKTQEKPNESKRIAPAPMCGNYSKKQSHYINVQIKKLLQKEHGTKCSIPGCIKLSAAIHHTQRFALSKTHDPRFLAPLCKEHHAIAHLVDLKYWEKRRLVRG